MTRSESSVRSWETSTPKHQGTVSSNRPTSLFGSANEPPLELVARDILRALYRNRVLLLASVVLVSMFTFLAVRSLPATYTATARVLIRTEALATPSYLSGIAAVSPGSGFESAERRLETEIQLASSRGVVDAAVQESGVTYDQVYHAPIDHLMGPVFASYNFVQKLLFDKPAVDRKTLEATIAAVSKSLSVGLVKPKGAEVSSNLIEFSVPATDPQVAQTLLSSIVGKYLALQADMAKGSAEQALITITGEADFATGEAEALREQLQRFLATGGSGAGRAVALDASGQNRALDRFQSSLFDAETALANANRVFLETADTVQRLRQRVDLLKGRVKSEIGQTASQSTGADNLRQQLQAAEFRESELQRKVREVELVLRAGTGLDRNRIIVDAPRLPTSSDWKKRFALVLLGVIAGCCLGLFLMAIREFTSNSLRTPDDIRRSFGVSPIGVIGRESVDDIREAVNARHGQRSSTGLVESLRRIANRLQRLRETDTILEPVRMARGSIVLVSGAHRKAGASTVTFGLASILGEPAVDSAFLGEPTVVAIADESEGRPMSHLSLQIESGTPRGERVAPTKSQFTILGNELHDGVGVVEAKEKRVAVRAQFTTSLIERQRLASAVVDLSVRHRWVIIDGGPYETGLSDALAPLVDFRILVVDASRTGRQVVRDILAESAGDDVPPMMFVLNRVERELPSVLYNRM